MHCSNHKWTEIALLARGAIVPQISVRTSVLQSISAEIDMSEMDFSEEIWLACHDDMEENVELGREIWEESGFEVSAESAFLMLPYLENPDKQLRRAAARAIADTVKLHPSTFQDDCVAPGSLIFRVGKAKSSPAR